MSHVDECSRNICSADGLVDVQFEFFNPIVVDEFSLHVWTDLKGSERRFGLQVYEGGVQVDVRQHRCFRRFPWASRVNFSSTFTFEEFSQIVRDISDLATKH